MSLLDRIQRAIKPRPDDDPDPHNWRLPTSYALPKPGANPTIIPNPKIFRNAFIPAPSTPSLETALAYPDASHAAVHLALLECFYNLRRSAAALEVDAAALPPEYEEKSHTTSSAQATRSPGTQRWQLLLRLAATRFAAWWTNIDDVLNHAAAYAHHAGDRSAMQLARDYLPPLDVLLVWYVLMLSPESYRAACEKHPKARTRLLQLCFPWPAVRDAIDMEQMQMVLPSTAQALFSTLSGQSANILEYLQQPPVYSDDSALPFDFDIATEMGKHERFIEGAHAMLWIRAPALHGSLIRASVDYLDFQMASAGKASEAVPFGVELLWRTHRLFPRQYDIFVQEVGNTKQTGSISMPSRSICACWTCERIRDDAPQFKRQLMGDSLGSSSSQPDQSPLSELSSAQLRQIKDDLGFHHAVEKARTAGKPLPTRPPTAAEKEAERLEKQRQKEVGYRPGLHEYLEILPDGRRRIRSQKLVAPYGNGMWTI